MSCAAAAAAAAVPDSLERYAEVADALQLGGKTLEDKVSRCVESCMHTVTQWFDMCHQDVLWSCAPRNATEGICSWLVACDVTWLHCLVAVAQVIRLIEAVEGLKAQLDAFLTFLSKHLHDIATLHVLLCR